MKKIIIILISTIVVVFLLHLAFFTFFNTKGKDLLIQQIKKNLGQDLIIDSLVLKFPFNIEAKGVKLSGLEFKSADISVVWFNPFTHKLTLDTVYIDGLRVKVNMTEDNVSIGKIVVRDLSEDQNVKGEITDRTEEPAGSSDSRPDSAVKKNFSLAVKQIRMINSETQVSYAGKKGAIEVVLDKISLDLKGLTYPKLSNFYIKLTSYVSSMEDRSESDMLLGLDGWVDYANRNMDLALSIDNFNYYSFKQYYPSSWQPEKLNIKEAMLSLDSRLASANNNLTIDSELFLDKIIFEEVKEGEELSARTKTIKTIIALLKGDKEKPSIKFSIKTKMDSPKLDFSSFKQVLKSVIPTVPTLIVEEVVGGTVDKIKKNVNETIGKTSEITVDTIVGTFKSVVDTISEKLNLPMENRQEEPQTQEETTQN